MSKLKHAFFAFMILVSTSAMAEPKAGALGAVQAWADALNRKDLDAVVASFANDASFFGTTSKTLISSPEGIRKYFEAVYAKFSPFTVELGQTTVSELSADSAVVTGFDLWKVTINGMPAEGTGRLSVAVARRDGQWRIVSFHRSAIPN